MHGSGKIVDGRRAYHYNDLTNPPLFCWAVLLMATLNRDLPIPLYHQLKTLILQEIEAGDWKPDQQLPTEEQLSARFRVSKITVRQALRELANLGWVRREQGRGTFVQKPALEEGPRKLTGFTAEMRDHGLVATSQVLDKGIIPA